ncbi:MAG: hypothetical protein ABJA79_00480 [Parafilimonas sp.]
MVKQESFIDSNLSIPNGRFCWYDSKGDIDSTGIVSNGVKAATWIYYNESIKSVMSIVYKDGHLHEKRDYNNTFILILTE